MLASVKTVGSRASDHPALEVSYGLGAACSNTKQPTAQGASSPAEACLCHSVLYLHVRGALLSLTGPAAACVSLCSTRRPCQPAGRQWGTCPAWVPRPRAQHSTAWCGGQYATAWRGSTLCSSYLLAQLHSKGLAGLGGLVVCLQANVARAVRDSAPTKCSTAS
jgi:hypothetical protein